MNGAPIISMQDPERAMREFDPACADQAAGRQRVPLAEKLHKVLVVDDSPEVCRSLDLFFRARGVKEVVKAYNGREGIEALKAGPPDLIICDINMPEMDGIEFIRHLADLGFDGRVILVTGETERLAATVSDMIHSYKMDLLGTILKPFTGVELEQALRQDNDTAQRSGDGPSFRVLSANEIDERLESSIDLVLQPKVSVKDGALQGAECLARWRQPDGTLLPPSAFIPLCEQAGLTERLNARVISRAFEIGEKLGEVMEPGFLAINISAGTLCDIKFPDRLENIAKAHGQPLSNFVLEITETSLMHDLKLSIEVLSRLSLKRAVLAVDDFGTGHSTFTQLQSVPANELKLDRSYVSNAIHDKRARAILEASVELARKLSLSTVAEGVEDEATLGLLRELNVDKVQGYLVAKPMPLDHFQVWRKRWPNLSQELFKAA